MPSENLTGLRGELRVWQRRHAELERRNAELKAQIESLEERIESCNQRIAYLLEPDHAPPSHIRHLEERREWFQTHLELCDAARRTIRESLESQNQKVRSLQSEVERLRMELGRF